MTSYDQNDKVFHRKEMTYENNPWFAWRFIELNSERIPVGYMVKPLAQAAARNFNSGLTGSGIPEPVISQKVKQNHDQIHLGDKNFELLKNIIKIEIYE